MYWNYRVIKKPPQSATQESACFEVHEVFYDENDDIEAWTKDACSPMGETMEELIDDINYFQQALKHPVLMEQAGPDGKAILVEVEAPA